MSDARRLKVHEQAREPWGAESAEDLTELVVPAVQDMATKADVYEAVNTLAARMDGLATKEYVLRMLLIALTPLYLGMLGLSLGVAGLYFNG